MMESVFAYYDGEKFIPEKKIEFLKGQKVILTVLEDEIKILDESNLMYNTSANGGSLDYLFEEGEAEYSINDCKEKFK